MGAQPPYHWHGLSKCNLSQRLRKLVDYTNLTDTDIRLLQQSSTPKILQLSDQLIENNIGSFPLPLGIAPHFHIDGHYYTVPMAIEETSVIAAASHAAKWLQQSPGTASQGIITRCTGKNIIGQILISRVKRADQLAKCITAQKKTWIMKCHQQVIPNLVKRGGGIEDLVLRLIRRPDGDTMAVIHVLLNPVDAMGANLVSQVCEYLKMPIERDSGEQLVTGIVSNLNDQKLTHARVAIDDVDTKLAETIVELSLFAQLDPYRAATNNKGVMNGIDALLIATGNDWRSVEAAVHAYSCQDGQYRPITHWYLEGNQLIGELTAPIIVGTVGGVTRLHPIAQLSLRLLDITHAEQLSRIAAAVGLVQNLGAMIALASGGITKGHMQLHISNIIAQLDTNLTEQEKQRLKTALQHYLEQHGHISLSVAQTILMQL